MFCALCFVLGAWYLVLCAGRTKSNAIVTEPRAVATGLLSHADVFNKQRAGRYRSRFCNSGQRLTLIIFDISYGVGQFLFCPKVFLAAAVRPWTLVRTPTTAILHRPRCVCFERIQDRFRLAIGRDDCMNMICSHIQRPQRPSAYHAGFSNTRFDRCSLRRIKNHGSLFEQGFFVSFSPGVGRQLWSIIPSVKAIDRSPRVTM